MDSVLRPRDIQARIRSGESPETVAAAAQTSIERIMTFASPVLAERAYVAQQAQKASVRRRTGDGAPGQLGAAVAERLATEQVEIEDVEWDAWRREDGRWTLVAEYAAASGPERAEFVYDAAGRYVTATDEQSRWLVGERVTSDPGSGYGSGASQLHLGDDAIELVTGRRPAPPVDLVVEADSTDPAGSTDSTLPAPTPLRRAPHPVDALLDRDEPVLDPPAAAEAPEAPEAPPAPEAPAARAVETPTQPDEITVDLTDLTETAARARAGRPARPARPARPMADADWMATQASERLSGPAAPPEPAAVASPEPAAATSPAAVAPAPGEAETLFEVPSPEAAPQAGDTAEATAPPVTEASAEETADSAAKPARQSRAAKSAKSAKGRAAIPSWDEIMFGSSNSE